MAGEHALLSASAAYRWFICTPAPRFEESLPDSTSVYAEEGALAHTLCELKAGKLLAPTLSKQTVTKRTNAIKKDPLYAAEMERTSDIYVEHLYQKSMTYTDRPVVALEVRVDYSEYAPEGFGTCDCLMIGGDMLDIVDYKHGKGLAVDAHNNPQMRLYALGALAHFAPFYGDSIKAVRMAIVQPRLRDEASEETLSVAELRAWGESIKPVARAAWDGDGDFVPGEHCRFCRGAAMCRARAMQHLALEDFKDLDLPTPVNAGSGNCLTAGEVGDLLRRGAGLVSWYKALEDFAAGALLAGEAVPGWKLVEGRSVRAFTDTDAAFEAARAAGYNDAMLYERKPLSLAGLEKLMGRALFADRLGAFVSKPPGKPTLTDAFDPRPTYSSAESDFKGAE